MKKKIQQIIKKIDTFSKIWIISFSLVLVIIITLIDYLIQIDLGISIFYLIPILLVTWYTNRKLSFLFCFICSLAWFAAEITISRNTNLWIEEWNATVRFSFFLILSSLLSELKNAYEREKKLARIDNLTGAFNRRYFREILQEEIERFDRYHHSFTLAYFDVDNFKMVNDKFGHSRGDDLLITITETIKFSIRQTDVLSRLGGDEFAVLLLEIKGENTNMVLKRIQEELSDIIKKTKLPISFSIGAITYYQTPKSVDHAIEEVDRLMYKIKKTGKNGIQHTVKY
ncbi:MAG: diguanylate cyclase [Crocosphaera sp.]|nr:diguanylate cyclase [Crocosphaera sp.]